MIATVQVNQDEVGKLSKFVFDNYKFDLSEYAFSSLRRRVERILMSYNLDSVEGLITMFIEDEMDFERFITEVTVNTTEMFRDPSLWMYLRNNVLPSLREFQTIRIWHAGCSTGEEVYTMAILLKELDLLDKTRITATDINDVALKRARSLHLPRKSIKQNVSNYKESGGISDLDEYFVLKNNSLQVNSSLMKNVRFKKHDLSRDDVFSKFDLILCRNVFIYFNYRLQNRVLVTFRESMMKNGYLVIGSKESLTFCDEKEHYTTENAKEKVFRIKTRFPAVNN